MSAFCGSSSPITGMHPCVGGDAVYFEHGAALSVPYPQMSSDVSPTFDADVRHLADFSVIRQTCLGIGFTDMDPESFEAVLKALPADTNLNDITEARLYELCIDNGITLPRFPVNSVDFRVNYPKIADYYLGNKGKCKFVMSLRTQNKLWKSFSIHGRHFAPFDVFNVAKWITASGEVFRINFFAVKFLSMKAMTDFIDFLQEARTDRYPPPVKIVFDSCEFTRISALNMRDAINRFVEECGVAELSFTNVRYEDVEMLSNAVSWSKAYKLKNFAFHTIKLTKTQAHLTKTLLKPFLNPHRCTEHVSINGFSLDLALSTTLDANMNDSSLIGHLADLSVISNTVNFVDYPKKVDYYLGTVLKWIMESNFKLIFRFYLFSLLIHFARGEGKTELPMSRDTMITVWTIALEMVLTCIGLFDFLKGRGLIQNTVILLLAGGWNYVILWAALCGTTGLWEPGVAVLATYLFFGTLYFTGFEVAKMGKEGFNPALLQFMPMIAVFVNFFWNHRKIHEVFMGRTWLTLCCLLFHILLMILAHIWNNNFRYRPLDQDNHAYVGLASAKIICYLNPLIQSLYMTPEFRNILYTWQFNGTVEEAARSVPYQLQRLFALLQSTTKSSLETLDLTRSFGWEGSDAYEQHDVQKLFRVMLEALEHQFRKSEEHKSFIQNLYKGTMEDFIKCHGCNREKIREDIFNDLSLAIKESDATQSFKSLEEALRAFVKSEILSGNNKYKCENCNSYQEAEKGFRFKEFPYLFVIQLKRFTVDYSSGFRVKLNDVVTFPDYLDLNSLFVPAAPDNGRDVDGWLNKPPTCPEVQAMLANGKDVYELFAIMIHQGSATGGHYFAYIKNLEQSQWLCFNDTQVMPVDSEEVKQGFASAGENNKNVCQMMYCRIDPERNEAFTRNADLPEHVMNWLKQWDEEESRQAKELIRLDSLVNVHCLLNDERSLVDTSPHGSVDRVFNRKDTAATVVKQFCPYYLECGIHITPETAVLFKSNSSYNFTDMTPVDPQTTIDHLLKKSYHTASELNFILEVNSEAYNLPAPPVLGDFGILTETLRTLDFLTVDITHNLVRSCKRICSTDVEMVYHLRHRIKALFPQTGVDGIPCRIVLDNMIDDGSPMKLIDDDSQTVGELLKYKFHNMRFYIDCGDPERLKADRLVENFIDSQMCRIIEKKKFGIHVMIQLPSDADYRQAGLRPPSANGVGANVVRSVVDDDSEYAVHVGESGYSYIRNCRYVNVIVDHLQYTKKLIEWIGRYLDISSDKIGLAKHYSDTDVKGYDMTLYATETVKSSFASVSRVTVTLKVPCKPGEKLVRVVEFDLNNESCPDNWPTLFSIPVTDDTLFADFKAQCLTTFNSAYAEKLESNSVRLREIANVGAPVLSLNKAFKDRRNVALDGIIALQRVKPGVDVYVVKEDAPEMASIIVRRFCPSTLETMPPFEILLPVRVKKRGFEIVKAAISDHTNLVPKRIGLSVFLPPTNTFARWPFTRSTLSDLVEFRETVKFPSDFNGKSVYFIDRNEPKKIQIRERENDASTNERSFFNFKWFPLTARPWFFDTS